MNDIKNRLRFAIPPDDPNAAYQWGAFTSIKDAQSWQKLASDALARIEQLEDQAACNYEHQPHGFCSKCGWFGTREAE